MRRRDVLAHAANRSAAQFADIWRLLNYACALYPLPLTNARDWHAFVTALSRQIELKIA
jgi:hypothetical protein